jgi:thymidylate synthase
MICVFGENPEKAWKKAFIELYKKGKEVKFNGFYKNESAVIEIVDITGNSYSKYYPLKESALNDVKTYLLTGANEHKIEHEWTILYRQRLFVEDNHLDQIVNTLKEWPDCPRAQVCLWKNGTDLRRSEKAPCLQLLWFKNIGGNLDLHVHMRTTDCYGKLLLNFNEFIALQIDVAKRLSLGLGYYRQFIDSLHFHEHDTKLVDETMKKLINEA